MRQTIIPQALKPVVITTKPCLSRLMAFNPEILRQMFNIGSTVTQGGLNFDIDGVNIQALYQEDAVEFMSKASKKTRTSLILPTTMDTLTEGIVECYQQGKGLKTNLKEGYQALTEDTIVSFDTVTITAENLQDKSYLTKTIAQYADRPVIVLLSEESKIAKEMTSQVKTAMKEGFHFILVEENKNILTFKEVRKDDVKSSFTKVVPEMTIEFLGTWFTQVSMSGTPQFAPTAVYTPSKVQTPAPIGSGEKK